MSTGSRTRRPKGFVTVSINRARKRRSGGGRMPAPLVLALVGIGFVGAIALGGPLSLLWGAAAAGGAAGGTAWYQHRQGTRKFREATRKERERAERARRARIRTERERELDRQSQRNRPAPPPDGRIVTPPGCTSGCFGASKADPEGKCECPCGGAHHGEGYRLRRERSRERRRGKANEGK